MYEFMKPVKVRSLCIGGLIDESGRFLKVIGNMPIKENDTVWTDGNVAYGHVPIKSTVKPMWADGGYPVLADGVNGYVRKSGQYKAKDLNIKNNSYTYLINTKDKIFGVPDDYKNLNVIDAENNIPRYSYEKNQYYTATMTQQCFSCSNIKFNGKGEITQGNLYSSSGDYLRIHTVTDSAGIGYSSSSYFNPMQYGGNIIKIIADNCKCKGGYLNYLSAQIMDFRFINKGKDWEAIVVYYANGRITVPPIRATYDFEYIDSSTRYNSYTHEFVSRSHFIGQYYIFKYLNTTTYTVSTAFDKGYNSDIDVDLYNVRIVAKINSKNEFEVLQKRIQTAEKEVSYITSRTVDWLPISECSLLYIPFDAVGTFSYYMQQIGEIDSNYESQLPAGASFLFYTNFDMKVPTFTEHKSVGKIKAIDIDDCKTFDISLNDSYKATTDLFNLYNIRQGGKIIVDNLECVKNAYLVEPAAGSNYDEFKKGKGWNIKKTSSKGFVTYEHSTEAAGYYVDGKQFHFIPHVCLININNGYLLAYRSCYLQGGLYKITNKGKELLGDEAENLRFNFMPKVKPFIDPKNRNNR